MTALETRKAPPEAPEQSRWSRDYGSVVLGVVLLVTGGLWLLDAMDLLDLRAALILPGVLTVVGLALIFGASSGPHSGLVVFGVFLTIAVVAAAVTPPDAFSGGIGERQFRVGQEDALQPSYNVGVGDLRLDLRDLDLTEPTTVDVTVGAGEMRIQLPADIPVRVDASVGAGEVVLLDQSTDGLSVNRTYESPGFADADVTLTLDLDVATGRIEVTR